MLDVELYVPGKIADTVKAESIYVDTLIGKIGILPAHMKLLTVIDIGKMEWETKSKSEVFAIAGGLLKVQDNRVEIYSSAVEKKDDIDKKRAKKAKERAQDYIRKAEKGDKKIDVTRAKAALSRAVNRLEIE